MAGADILCVLVRRQASELPSSYGCLFPPFSDHLKLETPHLEGDMEVLLKFCIGK